MAIEYNLNENGELAIKISGRFDHSVHEPMRKATLEAEQAKTVLLDLSRSTGIDSSALGMILILHERLGNNTEALKVKGTIDKVKEVFKLSGVDRFVTFI